MTDYSPDATEQHTSSNMYKRTYVAQHLYLFIAMKDKTTDSLA